MLEAFRKPTQITGPSGDFTKVGALTNRGGKRRLLLLAARGGGNRFPAEDSHTQFLLLALLAGLLALSHWSCGGAKVVQIEADPAFTYDAVSSASVAIGGVTAAVGDEHYRHQVRRDLPRLLAERIREKRKDLTILDPQQLWRSIGAERQAELLDRYETTGQLDTAGMITLFDATRGLAHYVTFARIETDSIARTKTEDTISVDHKTERYLGIAFQIYDISKGNLVWSGSISDSDYDLQIDAKAGAPDDDCSSLLSFAACVLDVISWFEGKDEGGFPPPPRLEDLTKRIFDKFAKELPQEGPS